MAERFAKVNEQENQGVAWQHNTKNIVFVYINSSYMNSYTTQVHDIIVKYLQKDSLGFQI